MKNHDNFFEFHDKNHDNLICYFLAKKSIS